MRISDWSSDVCSSDLEKRLNTCPVSRFRKAIGSRGCVAKRRQSVKLSPDGFPLRKCIRNFAECSLGRLLITGKRDIAARLRIAKIAFGPAKHENRRSDEHTSEPPSLIHRTDAVYCFYKK